METSFAAPDENGFSLVELSIVLVILGLLTGGILGGQSLIHASELRAVTTEFNGFQTAIMTFREKYRTIPGDMANATQFWLDAGVCAAVEANSHTTALSGGTCDGNGNGEVHRESESEEFEHFLFWHHLQLAGLISGQYSGVRGASGSADAVIRENVPVSKFSNAGWGIVTYPEENAGPTMFEIESVNALQIGLADNDSVYAAALTPEEAWDIDTKLDDGKPAKGNVIARFWNNACADASSRTDFDSDYRLTDSTVRCMLLFRESM